MTLGYIAAFSRPSIQRAILSLVRPEAAGPYQGSEDTIRTPSLAQASQQLHEPWLAGKSQQRQ